MKSAVAILYLALSLVDISSSTPINLHTRSLDPNLHDVAKPVIMVPVVPRSLEDSSIKTLERRGGRRKPPKNKDDDKPSAPGAATKERAKTKLTTEIETKTAQRDAMQDEVTARRKANDDAEAERLKRQKKEEEEAERNKNAEKVLVKIDNVSKAQIQSYWKEFQSQKRGLDGKGFVKKDDIADAFTDCIPKDGFLFWSSGGTESDDVKQAFQKGAIWRYEAGLSKPRKYKIASAVHQPKCTKDLAPMKRESLTDGFIDWVQEKAKEEHIKKHPKDKGKRFQYVWRTGLQREAKGTLNYDFYWAEMSAGYAKGAHGEVHYLRPKRAPGETGDYPGKHWVNYELPELKKNTKVTVVKEFNMEFRPDKNYRDAELIDKQGLVRVGPGAVPW